MVNQHDADTETLFGVLGTALPEESVDVGVTLLRELKARHYHDAHRLLNAALQPEQHLASGSRSQVFTIPHLNDFVLRVPNATLALIREHKGHKPLADSKGWVWVLVDDPMPERHIGQVVALLVGSSGTELAQILRRQRGVTYDISYADLFERYNIDDVLGYDQPVFYRDIAQAVEAYEAHLTRIAQMPQEAYDHLAETLILLKERGLHFDPCALNVLVDTPSQRFYTIDHHEDIGPYENVLGMACALMDSILVDLDTHAIRNEDDGEATLASDPVLQARRATILSKIISAANRTGLAFPPEACPLNTFGFHQRSFDMDAILRMCGISMTWAEMQHIVNTQRDHRDEGDDHFPLKTRSA